MLRLSNGITVMIDHVTWFSLREDAQRGKWLLQFGYAGGDKTFVAFEDQVQAEHAYEEAAEAIRVWVTQS